ncbi:MAG: D-tyrosyl-tRNA(Tyr) deacylase [Lachnospiraceae bacterium]|nr:D-tyrosyl-tRNA(Tyr) deacylase [Lachnospiraceae bacterium]
MRFVIQRVTTAQVEVDGNIVGKIDDGFLVLIGVCDTDNKEIADKMVAKMQKLRIFDDADGKTNLDIHTIGGNLLLISQFTLYADCRKGNRPSFIRAGAPDHAEDIYNHIVDRCREAFPDVQTGVFGAEMHVSLLNDGPFTVILDSEDLF